MFMVDPSDSGSPPAQVRIPGAVPGLVMNWTKRGFAMTSKFIAMAAAVVASATAAGAADLGHPVKAAVDYVKVCDT